VYPFGVSGLPVLNVVGTAADGVTPLGGVSQSLVGPPKGGWACDLGSKVQDSTRLALRGSTLAYQRPSSLCVS
jgi:hypothetical protein